MIACKSILDFLEILMDSLIEDYEKEADKEVKKKLYFDIYQLNLLYIGLQMRSKELKKK